MVDESSLTVYSKSSEFVQQYALGKGLLSDTIPENDIVFTGPMVILLDALIRSTNALPFSELEAGTGLEIEKLRSAIDKCEENDLIRLEDGGITLNKDSDTVDILLDMHSVN